MATENTTSRLYGYGACHRLQVKAPQNTAGDNTLELVHSDLTDSCTRHKPWTLAANDQGLQTSNPALLE